MCRMSNEAATERHLLICGFGHEAAQPQLPPSSVEAKGGSEQKLESHIAAQNPQTKKENARQLNPAAFQRVTYVPHMERSDNTCEIFRFKGDAPGNEGSDIPTSQKILPHSAFDSALEKKQRGYPTYS